MRTIYNDIETDAGRPVDASNAFNAMNRAAMLHNIGRICPTIYLFALNCYQPHARLFIIGSKEIKSKEGTTQGDPIAMAIYEIGSIPFMKDTIEQPLITNA